MIEIIFLLDNFLFFFIKKKKITAGQKTIAKFQDFHRPNGAKILRFGNFPHPLTCLGGVENCQKSKSFGKIWLWKSWNFAIIFWP